MKKQVSTKKLNKIDSNSKIKNFICNSNIYLINISKKETIFQ